MASVTFKMPRDFAAEAELDKAREKIADDVIRRDRRYAPMDGNAEDRGLGIQRLYSIHEYRLETTPYAERVTLRVLCGLTGPGQDEEITFQRAEAVEAEVAHAAARLSVDVRQGAFS